MQICPVSNRHSAFGNAMSGMYTCRSNHSYHVCICTSRVTACTCTRCYWCSSTMRDKARRYSRGHDRFMLSSLDPGDMQHSQLCMTTLFGPTRFTPLGPRTEGESNFVINGPDTLTFQSINCSRFLPPALIFLHLRLHVAITWLSNMTHTDRSQHRKGSRISTSAYKHNSAWKSAQQESLAVLVCLLGSCTRNLSEPTDKCDYWSSTLSLLGTKSLNGRIVPLRLSSGCLMRLL